MNAQRKIEKIRSILVNDGRVWEDRQQMLEEIESIVEPQTFTLTHKITEEEMDKALTDPKEMDLLRGRVVAESHKRLEDAINTALRQNVPQEFSR